MMMVIEVPPKKLKLNFSTDYKHLRVVRLHKEAANTKKKKKTELAQFRKGVSVYVIP